MVELLNVFAQRIQLGNGASLAFVGMTVVFSGLILLFFSMLLLRKIMIYYEGKSTGKVMEKGKESVYMMGGEKVDMDRLAAVIGITLHLHSLRNREMEITIKRKEKSPWSIAHRYKSMERL